MANGRKRGNRCRIQPIDLAILVLILLCAAGLAVRAGTLGVFVEKTDLEDHRVRFLVSNIAATSAEAFMVGDTFTLASYHEVLGVLVEVESVTPAVVYVENERQEIVRAQYPEGTRVDLVGILEARGVMSEDGFLLGGTLFVSPGIEYRVQSEHMDIVLKIIDIRRGEKAS